MSLKTHLEVDRVPGQVWLFIFHAEHHINSVFQISLEVKYAKIDLVPL